MIKKYELASPKILLGNLNFFRVWFSGFLFGTTRWLEVLAVSIYVLDVTGSPFIVALTMFLRMLPMFIFGGVVGAFAEIVDGKRLLVCGLLTIVAVYGILSFLSFIQSLQIWQLIIGVFLSGIFWSLELPVRRTMVAEIAGIKNIGTAMGLDTATNNFTRMLGPFFGGVLYEFFGLHGALILGAGLYLLSAWLLLFVAYERHSQPTRKRSVVANMIQGMRYVKTNSVLKSALGVTIIFNLFGFACVSMVPVIARQELELAGSGIGIITASEGLGAFFGSILVAFFGFKKIFYQVYFFGAALYLLGLIVFSVSTLFWVSFLALWLGGMGLAGFSSMQAAIIISNAPLQMRTRLMGVLTMCIGTGPVGILIIGFLANYFGAVSGVFFVSSIGLLSLFISGKVWPELLRLNR